MVLALSVPGLLAQSDAPAAVAPSAPALLPLPTINPETAAFGDIGTGLFYALPDAMAAASFRAHADAVGVIAPQSFSLNRLGELRGSVPEDLAQIAHSAGVAIMPLVVNAGFSTDIAVHMLHYARDRERAVENLVAAGTANNLAGWQIDFEGMPSSARADFTRFVTEAAEALHAHGMKLSVAVAARTDDNPNTDNYRDFSGVYDYAALGRAADFLSVMAYPESDASHPGPLAGTPWVEQVLTYILSQVPADKISLGLPTYQTDWVERREIVYDHRRVDGRMHTFYHHVYRLVRRSGPVTVNTDDLNWDPVLQTSYRISGSGRDLHITWVEDQRSFAAKLRLVAKYHLRGYSVWRIGLEDPDIWNEIPVLNHNPNPPAIAVASGSESDAGSLLNESVQP